MIITISGLHGTGKSTIGKLLAEKLGIEYYSTGQAFRDLAKEKHMTIEDFTFYTENHPEIDNELDDKVLEKANKGNIIVDSQLSGHLLKSVADFKIILVCPLKIRVKRMAERDLSTFEDKLKETLLREKSELERFRELYNIDLSDEEALKNLYDMVINTQNLTIQEVLNKILLQLEN
jgi:cytidylate kinase